jgi:hypothetical protein
MTKDIIEILSFMDSSQAIQRMKFDAIVQLQKDNFEFCPFGKGGTNTAGVLINGLDIDLEKKPQLYALLQKRAQTATIMLLIADLYPKSIKKLPLWSALADVFLVPTPEMRNFLSVFTEKPVEVHIDPIDFGLTQSLTKTPTNSFKVVWFGYPESYHKSMGQYEHTLRQLHKNNELEYHIITNNDQYGTMESCIIHPYEYQSFLSLLETFDVCLLSHTPTDFFVNTLWKSENKAVLAINRGLACVASKTPAYERLFTKCGLQDYLFNSNVELREALYKVKDAQNRQRFLDKSQRIVLTDYSSVKMANDWVSLYRHTQQIKFKRI